MIDLAGKNIKLNNDEELKILFEYADEQGWKWLNDKGKLDSSFGKYAKYPFVVCFMKDQKTICWDYVGNIEDEITDFKDVEPYIKSKKESTTEKEMTAREFLEKLIKHLDCDGRGCENCKFDSLNNLMRKTLCSVSCWKTDDIDYLIELVSDDDPIYHPPMDNVRAANFIDDVLGGKELSKDEEEALKYAAEKLRKLKEKEE